MTLTELIALTEQPEQLLTEAQTRGFIVALAVSPYPLTPEAWLPYLWGGAEQAPFPDPLVFETYCETIVQLWNQTHEALLNETWTWPDGYLPDDEQIMNQNVREMSEGILQGWQLTKDDWENLMPEDSEDGRLPAGVLLAISLMYDPDTALVTLQQGGTEGLEQLHEIYHAIPAMLCSLARHGRIVAEKRA